MARPGRKAQHDRKGGTTWAEIASGITADAGRVALAGSIALALRIWLVLGSRRR
jgi:hypothetical protein